MLLWKSQNTPATVTYYPTSLASMFKYCNIYFVLEQLLSICHSQSWCRCVSVHYSFTLNTTTLSSCTWPVTASMGFAACFCHTLSSHCTLQATSKFNLTKLTNSTPFYSSIITLEHSDQQKGLCIRECSTNWQEAGGVVKPRRFQRQAHATGMWPVTPPQALCATQLPSQGCPSRITPRYGTSLTKCTINIFTLGCCWIL
jgi:hypothetical protein